MKRFSSSQLGVTMAGMKIRLLLVMPFLLCAGGCFMETRTYSLVVKNNMPGPVSVCVTKTNSPAEHGWESPEDLALPPHPASDQTPPGMTIPAGKTLKVDKLSGRFDEDHGRAFLRVYAGTPNLTQMIAISHGSVNRLDVPLNQGLNRIVITQQYDGSMRADVPPDGPLGAGQLGAGQPGHP